MQISETPEIGPVLQRRRKSLGLTLEQLADRSGVSKSMLSQVERGEANPTFAVLWALTRALGIELTDLLHGGCAPVERRVIELVKLEHTPEIRSADGRCTLRILSPPRLAGWTEWYELDMLPAGRMHSAPHAAGTMEHLTANTGGFEITTAGETRLLKAGETARYPADAPHCITNRAKTPARGLLVVLYQPAP